MGIQVLPYRKYVFSYIELSLAKKKPGIFFVGVGSADPAPTKKNVRKLISPGSKKK